MSWKRQQSRSLNSKREGDAASLTHISQAFKNFRKMLSTFVSIKRGRRRLYDD